MRSGCWLRYGVVGDEVWVLRCGVVGDEVWVLVEIWGCG